jgi:hypothetical protein
MALSSLNIRIGANTSPLRADLARAGSMMGRFSASIEKVGAGMTLAFAGYKVLAGIKYSIERIADLEYQMSTVKALTQATAKEFEFLSKNALALGASTRYTASEIAKLQQEYGRFGFSASEILQVTEATSNLAIATGEDLTQAAIVAATTLRQFNLDASEMGRVTDVIAKSLVTSALDLDKFSEAMKYVGPVAHSAGLSLEETSAMLSVLADAGIRGSQAGTSLRRILSEMAATGKPAANALREVSMRGITLTDAMDEVGRYAQTALIVLANQRIKLEELTESYKHVNGEALRMRKIMEDNLLGDWIKLTSAVDGFIQKGSFLNETLREMTRAMTKVANNPMWLLGPFMGRIFDAKHIVEANEELKKFEQFNANIAQGVNAAFASGDVEGFIRNLTKVGLGAVSVTEAFQGQTAEYEKQLGLAQYKANWEEIIKGIKTRQLLELQMETKEMEKQVQIAIKQAWVKDQARSKNVQSAASKGGLDPLSTSFAGMGDFDESGMSRQQEMLDKMGEGIGKIKYYADESAIAMQNLATVFVDGGQVMINQTMLQAEAMSTLVSGLAEYIGLLADGNNDATSFADSLLKPIAGMMIQLGKLSIAAGFTIAAIQKSLIGLQPGPAIAAGAALVAIGTAIKGLATPGAGGGSGGGGGGSAGAGSYSSGANLNVTIQGEFVMSGDNLVSVIRRTNNKQLYTRG